MANSCSAIGVQRLYRRAGTVRPAVFTDRPRLRLDKELQFGISSGTMEPAVDAGELRKEYTLSGLYRKDLSPDPFEQFKLWFAESIRTAGDREPNAMTLATASRTGVPSARVVLLKSFDERGVMFFTNYESRKAQQLAENPHAALNFHWPWLERQIQIEGVVEKAGREESEAYFQKRPIGSRLGAIVSKQSSVIESREKLEERLLELKAQYQETIRRHRNSGAATCWSRIVSNSGKGAKIGCTIVSSTHQSRTRAGRSNDWRRR